MSARWGEADQIGDLLDLHDGRLGLPLLDEVGIAELLARSRRIAMVGASANPWRPSHGVLGELLAAGYDVVPVNPNETVIEGLTCYPDVASAVAATGPVDIVDVFRRPSETPAHAREAVAVGAACLWLQLGIASREAGRIALDGGLQVVMDRCTIVEYRRAVAAGRLTPR